MADTIAGDASTTSTITIGGSTSSAVDTIGDHDWFAITLTAGQEVTIALNGVTLSDPYVRIRNSGGTVIHENDDYGSLNSQVSFIATYSGVYYIDIAAWADPQNPGANYPGVTGTYQLNVTAFQDPPVYTNDQIANQLTTGYWGGTQQKFVLDAGRQLTFNVTGLTTEGQDLARQALQTWSDITGISFVESASAGAQIMFTDDDPDGGAFTESFYDQSGNISSSHVNVDASWLDIYGATLGSYAFQAYIHEIGHALGLGHAGNYNTNADYPYDALYANDSWATSVMSYFSQTDSTYFNDLNFSDAHDVTPMVADILAMQQLYGLSGTTRSGNTTYGFNSNAGVLFDASQTTNVAYTIFDTGGTDTLDFSGYGFNQTIDLNPETFSNVGGERGNVTIARGTIIENAIGGNFKDIIVGNLVANVISGRSGIDTLTGGAGNDTFQDTVSGLNGDTITDFSIGDKIVLTDATLAGFAFNLVGTTLNFTGGSLTLSSVVNGTIVATAALGGGVQLSIQPAINDVRNDFNGDGRSDVLWRNDNGTVMDWLGQANGGFVGNQANSAIGVPASWTIEGTGDFNGDGRDDVLWRNSNGTVIDWLGQANGGFVGNQANSAIGVPASWHIEGVGDFNGDGRDDVLWRNDNGTVIDWLGQANGGFVSNQANSAIGVPTSWHIAGVGDFNGDGRDDVLWRNDNGTVMDWLAQANGGFVGNQANSAIGVPASWHISGVGDYNGDGRDDVLWRNDNGTVIDWLGQANGGFASNQANSAIGVPLAWHIQAPDIIPM